MADKKQEMEIWSWNEAFPGFDIEGATGIPRKELEKIFGDYDIKLQVPDRKDFLNPEQTGTDKFESEREVLTKFLNSLRAQLGVTTRPFNAYSDEEKEQLQLEQQYINAVQEEHAMASDPMKFANAKWREKLDQDERNWSTAITGKGREEGGGFIGTGFDLYNSETMEEGYNTLKNYFGDSFMGLSLTALRTIPENNKQNWAIAGELLGNLPLYFMDKKKLANAWLNPRKYPTATGTLALSAGVGAYTAATAYDGLNDVIRQLKGLPDPETSTDPRVENLLHGRNGLIFTAGAAGLDPVFRQMKGLARFFYGVHEGTDANALAKLAIVGSGKDQIPLGIAHVTDRSWAKWYGRVLGVFPFVGSPFRESKANIAWYLDKRMMDTFNELAPMSSVMDVGALVTKSAKDKFKWYAGISKNFYDDFYAKARGLDDFVGGQGYIPTYRIKQLAKNWKKQMEAQTTQTGYVGEGVPQQIGGIADASDFEKFLLQLGGLEDHVNANQFRGIQKKFNEAWRTYSQMYAPGATDSIVSDANRFKKALEQGLNDTKMWKLPKDAQGNVIQGAEAMMRQTIASLHRANKWFGNMANTYKSPLAKKFTLVDETMFVPGALEKQGWMYDDQLAKELFDSFKASPSKKALNDLSKIVRRNYDKPLEDPINSAARTYINEIYNAAGDNFIYNTKNGQLKINIAGGSKVEQKGPGIVNLTIFNPTKFAKGLKLGTPDGDEFLTEMWRQTLNAEGKQLTAAQAKTGLSNMQDLLKLAQIGYDMKIAETAQFVARRAVLAGTSGITGAFLATSAGVSPLTGVGMALLARHQSSILTRPQTLQWLVNTLDDTLSDKLRRANYVRLARVIFDDEPEIPEGLDIKDPWEVTNYLLGRNFGITGVDQSGVPPTERKPEGVQKTFEPIKAPLVPRSNVDKGPIESMGQEEYIRQNMENKQSNNVSAEVKSRMASNFVRRPGGPTRGKLNPNQREALAGGNLYGAIAQAKHGGAVYNDGIMNLANRRRA
jgi:hypothetical protein